MGGGATAGSRVRDARIVHLGLGAFFRAHGAIYLSEASRASGTDWGVIGVSLRSPRTRDRLKPQGWAYTAVELGPEGETARRVTILRDVLVAPEDPAAVLEAMAAPAVTLVTLTVTEKGYCHAPATGALDLGHPEIRQDIAQPLPVSAPGYLVRALQLRRARGLRPFTVMSCDNLPANGALTRRVTLDLARRIAPALAEWIAAEGAFPSTMVDRIVPATTEADRDRVGALTGRPDAAPVFHEPFRQWVIEDRFVPGSRPDLTAAGAQLVADVEPYEHMKLRMLNGTHSALAYLGLLAGHETIAEAVADAALSGFIERLWRDEIIPTVAPPPGEDLGAYARSLMARYRNPAIRHRLAQIAMDGSQKLPQRILAPLAENRAAGRDSAGHTLVAAAWIAHVSGRTTEGEKVAPHDPMAERLAALWRDAPGETVAGFLGIEAIFPEALRRDRGFAEALTLALARLQGEGVAAMLTRP